jgi:hypothetical protein
MHKTIITADRATEHARADTRDVLMHITDEMWLQRNRDA